MSLPSTYFCGRAQSSLIPLPSTPRVRSSTDSGATSSGGRTGVLRPQAGRTETEIETEIEKREQRTEKNFLKPLPHDFGLWTLDFGLWTLHFALCTLHFALIAVTPQSTADAALRSPARCRHESDGARPPTPRSGGG